ncbi:glutaredoxin [Ramaria rubella]|nr:glutaredoxin [Ramaria rubella]KAF8583708.1 glutaredoxin [Ramaria rubella]
METPENLTVVESAEHFQALLSQDLERVSLLNFWAPWAEPCTQMNQVVTELARKYKNILVLQIEAEKLADITESFEIEAVPSFIILRGHTLLARIAGADAAALTSALHATSVLRAQSHTDRAPDAPTDEPMEEEETPEQLNERMRGLMNKSKVVLFMKGSPDAPRCGFSRQTVAILREQEVEFEHYDILSDEGVRQGLKVLNNWPTFPQIIVNGEFVGGLDVLKESVETGEFKEIVAA